MYCGINTQIFKDIPCVAGAMSASELLQPHYPSIAGAFLQYASALVQNYLAQAGSTPELDQALSMLRQIASISQVATQKELETFADTLIASATGPFESDFYRIGYIAYAACSLYGPLSPRVLNKIANAQQYLSLGDNSNTTILQDGLTKFNAAGPPQYTPNGPPQFTPNGPPQFTPSGPPQFTPNGPPQFTPNGTLQSTQNFPQYPTNTMPTNTQNSQSNALKLTEMAKSALSSGNNDAALSLILAAMQEIKKS